LIGVPLDHRKSAPECHEMIATTRTKPTGRTTRVAAPCPLPMRTGLDLSRLDRAPHIAQERAARRTVHDTVVESQRKRHL